MHQIIKKAEEKKKIQSMKNTPTPILKGNIENKLEEKQVEKASKALLAFLKSKKENDNKDNEQDNKTLNLTEQDNEEDDEEQLSVYLIISTKSIPDKKTFKPIRIPLKHSILNKDFVKICLFTKDPQRTYKDVVMEQNLKSVKKVIGISKLKKKFQPYEAKRLLCNSFDLFLADARILPLLPKNLGKTFFEKRKLPCPIDIKNPKNMEKEIELSLQSTLYRPVMGPCNSIVIGKSNFESNQITENIMESITDIVRHIPKGWSNIQSISIKSKNTVALPIYNSI